MSGHGTTGAALRGKPGLSMTGFLIVEMIIGYEWFISGLAPPTLSLLEDV